MGRIEDHGAARAAQMGKALEVHHQIAVAEGGAPFGDPDGPGGWAAAKFVHGVPQIPGGQELSLLEVHGMARGRRRQEQIRLTAEEGGDLEHIHGFGHPGALVGLVDIREHRDAQALSHLRQDVQALLHGHPPVA